MSDDGEQDKTDDEGRSRPESAAGRRARRGPARANSGNSPEPKAKGKAAKAEGGAEGKSTAAAVKREKADDRQPVHRRLVHFLREVVAELQKVIWPTRKQMVTYTGVVLAFLAFMIVLVWVLDLAFGEVIARMFG